MLSTYNGISNKGNLDGKGRVLFFVVDGPERA